MESPSVAQTLLDQRPIMDHRNVELQEQFFIANHPRAKKIVLIWRFKRGWMDERRRFCPCDYHKRLIDRYVKISQSQKKNLCLFLSISGCQTGDKLAALFGTPKEPFGGRFFFFPLAVDYSDLCEVAAQPFTEFLANLFRCGSVPFLARRRTH